MINEDPRQRYARELPEWLQAEVDQHQATRRRAYIDLAIVVGIVLAASIGAGLAVLKNAGVL
ncbi:MAG: hypothetical protein ACK4IS_13235 [Erythrobacter sp.]